MWSWLNMDAGTVNAVLNLAGILLGGSALGVLLTHRRGILGLENADVADIRKHYAAELNQMRARDEVRDKAMRDLEKHWREMITLADQRHAECVAERDELRDQLNELKGELAGVKEQLRAQATDRVLLLEERGAKPSEEAPHSLAAAQRLKGAGNGGK